MKPNPNSYRSLEAEIIRWAEARKIIPNATPQAQLNKALEEMAELFKAESQQNLPEIKDAVGDVLVCLINYCAIKDIDMVSCLNLAYEAIKDRRGTLMPDGTFVKEVPHENPDDLRHAGEGSRPTTTEAVVEAVARAICVACEDNPDHQGDARGNEFRWQDYRDTALAAISAFSAAQQENKDE